MNIQEAAKRVLPFVSSDDTRPHLCRPALWPEHVVATDGHTMAVLRHDGGDWKDPSVIRHDDPELKVPPFQHVVPSSPEEFGSWLPEATPQLQHYPYPWKVCISIGAGKEPTVRAWVPARMGKRGKVLRPMVPMIDEQPLRGFMGLDPKERIGIDGGYLLRVVEFFGPGTINVYGNDKLSPIVFTRATNVRTHKDLLACPGFCVIMPMRI